jgi:hypothetical protein
MQRRLINMNNFTAFFLACFSNTLGYRGFSATWVTADYYQWHCSVVAE